MNPSGLALCAVVGLMAGWLFHRMTDTATSLPPQVPWAQPLALFLVAAILLGTAWSTRRTISQRPGRLSPHQAVNRLVLARACAYVGALAAGAYLGYAISWIGDSSSDMAGQRALRAALAGVAGLVIVVGGLLLERACRVPPEDDEP
jgi:MFS family permease